VKANRYIWLLLWITSILNSQWNQQVSNTTRHLYGIDMINENTGFAVGEINTIRKTTNGGLNWLTIIPPYNYDYRDVSFLDINTGVITSGPGNLMIQTYNSGVSWVVRFPASDPERIQFIDSLVAYATAGFSVIKSIDGCINWTIVDTSVFLNAFNGLYFLNKDTGAVVGLRGLIRTTTNGGLSWTQRLMMLPVQFGDSTLTDVMFVNGLTGYACGNNGIVVKTINGGTNWTYLPTGVLSYLQGIYFNDANTGTIVGNTGRIMRTTNGGINWINQASPLNYPLWDVKFVNHDTGWIVGFNGLILKTTTGGWTSIKPISSVLPSQFNLYQNYPNPFNPSTNIGFQIPRSSFVKIVIYDLLGRVIAILVNEQLKSGTYEVEWNATNEPSGTFLYTIQADSYTETKKLVILK